MARSAHHPSHPVRENKIIADPVRMRLARLRHIHPVTHERQIALIQTARAIRRCQPSPRLCPVEAAVRDQMLGLLPSLRVFALSLTNNPTWADDLVQDTMLRAWANMSRFERGSNLGAWLFTILRNSFYTQHRKCRHEVLDPDGAYARRLTVEPEQESALHFSDLRRALDQLPPTQREAVILVGAEGRSYEDAAILCGVAVGTMKSRVNRARTSLAALLQMTDRHDLGPDRLIQAALQEAAVMGPS
jgi:RNA polymerase sigma-70 factor (ECF subfamily)